MPAEIVRGWSPRLIPFTTRDGLAELWAAAIGLQLQRFVTARSVVRAWVSAPNYQDAGLEPAVARWKAVPVDLRFCPPGILSPCTEADVRMWLGTGSCLERTGKFIQW